MAKKTSKPFPPVPPGHDKTLWNVAMAARAYADRKAGGKATDYSKAVKKFAKYLKLPGER